MFNYKNEPIIVSCSPFDKKELLVIAPNAVIGCGLDNNNKVFIITNGNKRFYPIYNELDFVIEMCKYMYPGGNKNVDYEKVNKVFTYKKNNY